MATTREQATVFDEVAGLNDRARLRCPPSSIDDLVALSEIPLARGGAIEIE
jgi:hypothetical protein